MVDQVNKTRPPTSHSNVGLDQNEIPCTAVNCLVTRTNVRHCLTCRSSPVSQTSIELTRLWPHHPQSLVLTSQVEQELVSVVAAHTGVQRPLVVNACSGCLDHLVTSSCPGPHLSAGTLPACCSGEFAPLRRTPGGL